MKQHPLAVLLWLLWATLAGAAPPNIVFILADDLGYGDVGCYGGTTPTPNIDRLAKEGVRFPNFYANAPECTPTRTAFLTGRYQHRIGGLECAIGIGNVGRYDDAIRLAQAHDLGLPPTEPTLAKLLKSVGYHTACTGKWHLGYEPKFSANRHGFDSYFGPLGGGIDYFHHTEPDGTMMLYRDGKPAPKDGYITDLITEEAVSVINKSASPFFLYVPYTAPHTPLQGPDDKADKPLLGDNFQKQTGDAKTYAAMIRRLDDGVGAILKALDDRKLTDSTLVVFSSDNGGTKMARNAPLSGTKGQTMEGGIRVPCVVRWPGVFKPGTTSDHVGITMDLTTSFTRIAGAKPAADRPFDGIDILADVESGKAPQSRTLFWRIRRGEGTWVAARDGSLKWVMQKQGDKVNEMLFDVAADIAEKNDLAKDRPDEVKRLKGMYEKWSVEVQPSR